MTNLQLVGRSAGTCSFDAKTTTEEREQAGLARPGGSGAILRVPTTPFRRIPSTPSLSSDHMLAEGGASKESLAELWSDFLEREASEGKSEAGIEGSVSAAAENQPSGLGIK